MFTGISGSKTVEIAWTIAGFNDSVRWGSAARTVLGSSTGAGSGSGSIIGRGFIWSCPSFRGRHRFALERRLERVPCEARTLHPHGKLANAGEHGQLAHVLPRLVGRRRHDVMEPLEERARLLDGVSLDRVRH